jgi:hypothetical protein
MGVPHCITPPVGVRHYGFPTPGESLGVQRSGWPGGFVGASSALGAAVPDHVTWSLGFRAKCRLALNEPKTRIVYCEDRTRRGSYEHVAFDFVGYTFRGRLSRTKAGSQFVNFLPAIGNDERKRLGRGIRSWRLHRWSGWTLTNLARAINTIVRGW